MALSATSASSGAKTTTTTTAAATSAFTRTSTVALAAQATSLSVTAGVVATFGGTSSSLGLYSPAGMLASITQAGTLTDPIAVPAAGTDTAALVQNLADQAISGTLDADAAASGIYTAGNSAATGGADWAAILKQNPSAAGTVIAASFTSGIIDTLA